MIEKNYQPADIESRMSRIWEESGAFKAGRPERKDAAPFTIVIPPPNVTGSLHMGHALNNTLQDILCRFERMRGRDVLWQPGTDHAGIATQMVVERQLMERQEPGRRDIGRAKFLERVWQWKAESGGVIVNQLKRLGASCDWSRERFTMDEGLSRAVVKVFVELHREGLIYKDKRLVNWDPKLLTAISDLEVQQIEVKGNLWYLRYPIEGKTFSPDDPSTFVVVATTRPETMLGDTAVAIHPDNERIGDLIGQHVILPLVGRRIPIIGDDYADPEKGSGAVKITPAHDFNDFEVGKRHGLPQINVFDREGCMALVDNEDYLRGLPEGALMLAEELHNADRFAARKTIVARLEDFGFLEKIEPNAHMVPHGDRSGVVIEPYLTDQWYVDAKTMAQPAIAAVRSGATTFVPKNWEKTYFEWMENIQPWCISRQLWWGHQIPAWYGPDGKVFVAETEEEAVGNALGYYVEQEVITEEQGRELAQDPAKREGFIVRDEDVLDTWFSSGLWPFSTLGWPDDTSEVKRYYPTNVLVTGWDIIFFWVARMMMMGLHFMKDAPFSTVYIHRLVRDEKGAKMSKSKGNVIDPLGVIDDFGADALRFALARGAAHSHDIKLSPQLVETNRNFATKLWNACRFAEMNGCEMPAGFEPTKATETLNRWIAHETSRATREVTEAIEAYRFNDAANAIYRFVWNVYCDWYVELAKPVLMGEEGAAKVETRAMTAWARDEILKLLHPFMPFITEELWAVTAKRDGLLVLAEWPRKASLVTAEQIASMALAAPGDPLIAPVMAALDAGDFSDPAAEAEIGWVVDLVTTIRSVRSEMNIPPATLIPLVLSGASTETRDRAQRWNDIVKRLARLAEISFADRPPEGAVQLLVRGEVVALPLKGVIDLSAEKARLDKEIVKADADIKRVDAKLGNEKFVANAPEEIVEEEKEKREAAVERKAKILEALERIKDAITAEDRHEQLRKAASDLRVEMEQSAQRIRELVLEQPPHDLLGYLWSKFYMAAAIHQEDKSEAGPDKDLVNQFQFVLEYVHAVWSSHSAGFSEGKLNEAKVGELLGECKELSSKALFYAMASSQIGASTEFGEVTSDLEFHAKSAWVLMRGHRYQVLEEEFFKFVLRPHEEALKKVYGVGATAISEGIQSIAHSIRGGYGDAMARMQDGMEASRAIVQNDNVTLEAAIEKIKGDAPDFLVEMAGVFSDLFRGGICNLSRHTQLPGALLDDLAYEPGAEKEFFAAGDYCGTPYRTLPARIRPVVRLSDGYYATDGQFVRDSAYRAIQWGVIARLPDYREGWNKKQKELIEGAFPTILSTQLKDATLYEEVYFKDPATGEWAETDLVGIVDDTIFVVEAKAGVMAMHSPATNFDRHIRTIRELVLKAYKQCKRFLEYLSSGDAMPLYCLKDGKYEEVSKLRLKDFRRVVPIGLTVEAFTPFSAMCKQIPEVTPILGVHPFISMSVDDLFVLNRFLPTTGELFHYLEVRQTVAGLPKAMMFDEIDHLGAYVRRNRFDQDMEEQLKKADLVTWDSFSDVVDEHFGKEDWQTSVVPHQEYPAEVSELLGALSRQRPKGWLEMDAYIRNFGAGGRDNLAKVLRDLKPTLEQHPMRRFLLGNEKPVLIYLTRDKAMPSADELERYAEIACLTARVPSIPVIVVDCDQTGKFEGTKCSVVTAPPIVRSDYAELAVEAERQRSRYTSLAKPSEASSHKA